MLEDNRVYECVYRIRCSEVNRHGDVRTDTLFDYFQEAANIHAERLGCGFEALVKSRLAWVLSRIRLDVYRTPRIGDTLNLRTWPSGFRRLYAVREALFQDAEGELARLTSYWVLLDIDRMRPMRLPESLPVALPDNSDMPQYFDLGGRLSVPEAEHPMLLIVPEHFIDINGHANNARYWTLVSDWISRETGGPQRITTLSGHFLKETTAWTDVAISGIIHDDGSFSVQITDADGEKNVHFIAEGRVSFQPGQ